MGAAQQFRYSIGPLGLICPSSPDHNGSAPDGATLMANILRSLSTGWRMSSMRRELGRLSDGQLKDIGIHRGQIEDLTRYYHGQGPRPDSI
jgi:uncharacterized protein YjiS (DUF1127 family)